MRVIRKSGLLESKIIKERDGNESFTEKQHIYYDLNVKNVLES